MPHTPGKQSSPCDKVRRSVTTKQPPLNPNICLLIHPQETSNRGKAYRGISSWILRLQRTKDIQPKCKCIEPAWPSPAAQSLFWENSASGSALVTTARVTRLFRQFGHAFRGILGPGYESKYYARFSYTPWAIRIWEIPYKEFQDSYSKIAHFNNVSERIGKPAIYKLLCVDL